jgi:hypothetical protein
VGDGGERGLGEGEQGGAALKKAGFVGENLAEGGAMSKGIGLWDGESTSCVARWGDVVRETRMISWLLQRQFLAAH